MKHNKISRCDNCGIWAAILLGSASLGALAQDVLPSAPVAGHALKPGDIVYTDSGNAIDGGVVFKIDAASGERSVISAGGYLIQPFDVKIDAEGHIVVSDTSGHLLRIDPGTGEQHPIADNAQGTLGMPCGVVVERFGALLVANTQAIVRVEPATSQSEVVSSGGRFLCPIGVTVGESGRLFVLNRAFPSEVVAVNPKTGAQRVVSRAGYLNNPQSIAVDGRNLYITDVATADGHGGVGRVIRVDAVSGAQTLIAEGENLVGPVGIAVDGEGQLIVADPYTINWESADLFDGAIIRIDPKTRTQTLIVRGQDDWTNPRGVAVVPGPKGPSTPARPTNAAN